MKYQDWQRMSKTKKILPELRFPEFSNNETWADRKLSDVLFEHKEKSTGDEEVYSVSVHRGVVNQIEHLGRVFAASNTENYKRVLPGDIIYTKSPTGDFPFGIIKQSKVSKPVIVSPLYGVFKPETTDLGVILDAYFEYPERTINYLSSIVQKGAKNTINIHNDTFLSKSLILPLDKKEQRKIAACLSSLDEVIASQIEKMELLNNHKKGLMQNLFPQDGEKLPKYRFREFIKSGNWIEKNIGEYYRNLTTGMTPSRTNPDFFNGEIPWITSGELNYNVFDKTREYITEGAVKETNLRIYKPGTLFIAITGLEAPGTRGKCAINGMPTTTNQSCMAFEANEFIDNKFLFYWYQNSSEKLYSYAQGTKQQSFNNAIVEKFVLIHPSKKEQQRIASCLSALDEVIKAQTELIEELKHHKKGLMQSLFPKAID